MIEEFFRPCAGRKPVILFLLFVNLLVLVVADMGFADTIILGSNERLTGRVKTPFFRLHTPYGGIRIPAVNIKSIKKAHDHNGFIIITCNNDRFSGIVQEKNVDITLNDARQYSIAMDRVDQIFFNIDLPTHPVATTIFFMENNDRFSGRLLSDSLTIETGHEKFCFPVTDISRITFFKSKSGIKAEILKNDKTFAAGVMKEQKLRIIPESSSRIASCIGRIKKIQFNAEKWLAVASIDQNIATYDSDGDGVPDNVDACPDTGCAASVDKVGCDLSIDSDGDGVVDQEDKCPGTPKGLPVGAEGCFVFMITDFAFNRADIPARYFPELDKAAAILKKYPQIRVEVQGHTDNSGTMAYNKILSMKRAESVCAYLRAKGIASSRLIPRGYGYSRPIADNATEAGRARNRRVQLQQLP